MDSREQRIWQFSSELVMIDSISIFWIILRKVFKFSILEILSSSRLKIAPMVRIPLGLYISSATPQSVGYPAIRRRFIKILIDAGSNDPTSVAISAGAGGSGPTNSARPSATEPAEILLMIQKFMRMKMKLYHLSIWGAIWSFYSPGLHHHQATEVVIDHWTNSKIKTKTKLANRDTQLGYDASERLQLMAIPMKTKSCLSSDVDTRTNRDQR